MNLKNIANNMPADVVGKDEIFQIALMENPSLQESSIFWLIKKMIEAGLLIKVGRNKYCANTSGKVRKQYNYQFSNALQEIVNALEREFPLMEFQAWEAIQFNYFVNHQIAHNTFFVEVENMLETSIYEFLRDRFGKNVLLKPDMETCGIYAESNTIIVQNLITEAPVNKLELHSVVLEKLLVDVLTDKKVKLFIEESEFAHILEDAFTSYVIDESKLFRYARRRNAEARIKFFIREYTNIKLYLEGETR